MRQLGYKRRKGPNRWYRKVLTEDKPHLRQVTVVYGRHVSPGLKIEPNGHQRGNRAVGDQS